MLGANVVVVVVELLLSWQKATEKRKTSRESIIFYKYLKRDKEC